MAEFDRRLAILETRVPEPVLTPADFESRVKEILNLVEDTPRAAVVADLADRISVLEEKVQFLTDYHEKIHVLTEFLDRHWSSQ